MFKTLGYPDQWLIDKRWVILTNQGPLFALTGARDMHVWPAEERQRGVPRDEIVLDVGATSREEAEQLGIRPGDFIAPVSPFTVMAHNRYAAKAWDDRLGCVVMLEGLRKLKASGAKLPNTTYFVFTVQEENGLRGAHVAIESVKPDMGVALEPGIGGDVPGVRPDRAQERAGERSRYLLFDSSMIPSGSWLSSFCAWPRKNSFPCKPRSFPVAMAKMAARSSVTGAVGRPFCSPYPRGTLMRTRA